MFDRPFEGTIYGKKGTPQDKLWLGVPKKIFLTYTQDNSEKARGQTTTGKRKLGNDLILQEGPLLETFSINEKSVLHVSRTL